MAIKKANGRSNRHQANGGNASIAVMRHTLSADDKAGDVIQMGEFSIDTEYVDISVRCAAGAGGAVDVGIDELETGTVTADKFKAGVDITAAGSRVDGIIVEPVKVDNTHEVIVTLAANGKVGSVITVVATYRSNGA